MLFNVIPIWEGEFLNFDCSESPSRRGEIKNLARGPTSQGMANDRYINYLDNVLKFFILGRFKRESLNNKESLYEVSDNRFLKN